MVLWQGSLIRRAIARHLLPGGEGRGARVALFDLRGPFIRGSSVKQEPEEQAMPQPFTLRIPDSDIADLRERLARTRFPIPRRANFGLTGPT